MRRFPAQFEYRIAFSRDTFAPDDAMRGASEPSFGYVQNVLADIAPEPEGDIAYLCGNPNMVDACVEALKGFGLPMKHIRREKYVSLAPAR